MATKGAKAEEAPVVARLRTRIARVFAYVEDVMYVGLAALLALSAPVLLGATALTLGRSVTGGALPASIIVLLDQLWGNHHHRLPLPRGWPNQPRPRVMLHTRWSAEAWPQVKAAFTKALALRSQIRRAGWFTVPQSVLLQATQVIE